MDHDKCVSFQFDRPKDKLSKEEIATFLELSARGHKWKPVNNESERPNVYVYDMKILFAWRRDDGPYAVLLEATPTYYRFVVFDSSELPR